MSPNKIIFGTDGWRGIQDDELNEVNIRLVAQAFASYIKSTDNVKINGIAIGYDGRKSSYKFAQLFGKVLSGNGLPVFLSKNIIPTPLLSFYTKKNNLNAGVMITASHNPPEYNGVKFKGNYGGPFFTEETKKIELLIGREEAAEEEENITVVDMFLDYYDQLSSYIDFESIRKAGINVLVDSMGGAGGNYLETILKKHGCLAETIYNIPDEQFNNRLPEPIEQNLIPLKEKLLSFGMFSFGAGTDGDADRVGILLEDGTWLSAQYTILLLNDYLVNIKKVNGDLVKTSSVTDKIKLFKSGHRKIYDVQVGFKYICEMMLLHDVAIGCEESGGYGYKGHIPERDGILSALIIAEMLASSGIRKLSEYFASKKKEYGEIYYNRIDYKYKGDDRNYKLPWLSENPPDKICNFRVIEINKFYSSRGIVNGLKFILEGNARWLLIRSSETEPLIRFYAEGNSNKEVDDLLKSGKKIVLNNPGKGG